MKEQKEPVEKKEERKSFNLGEYLEVAKDKFLGITGEEKAIPIPLENIRPNPRQPRVYFDEIKLNELAASIKEKGVLQPIVVREIDDAYVEEKYEIVIGERRWRASKKNGLLTIPAIIKKINDKDVRTVALIENMQRDDLLFVETINAVADLKNELGDIEGVVAQISKTRKTIDRYLKIHEAISLTPEFAELFKKQAPQIDYTTASKFAETARGLAALKKSNNREYNRVLAAIEKSGLKQKADWLVKKFKKKEDKNTNKTKGLFYETNKEYFLSIKIKKNDKLTKESFESINSAIGQFSEKLSTILVASE